MSVNIKHTVDGQNKTSILNGHLTTILTKTKPKNYVKSDKIYFSILQDLLVNHENKMVKFSYKN